MKHSADFTATAELFRRASSHFVHVRV